MTSESYSPKSVKFSDEKRSEKTVGYGASALTLGPMNGWLYGLRLKTSIFPDGSLMNTSET